MLFYIHILLIYINNCLLLMVLLDHLKYFTVQNKWETRFLGQMGTSRGRQQTLLFRLNFLSLLPQKGSSFSSFVCSTAFFFFSPRCRLSVSHFEFWSLSASLCCQTKLSVCRKYSSASKSNRFTRFRGNFVELKKNPTRRRNKKSGAERRKKGRKQENRGARRRKRGRSNYGRPWYAGKSKGGRKRFIFGSFLLCMYTEFVFWVWTSKVKQFGNKEERVVQPQAVSTWRQNLYSNKPSSLHTQYDQKAFHSYVLYTLPRLYSWHHSHWLTEFLHSDCFGVYTDLFVLLKMSNLTLSLSILCCSDFSCLL